MSIHIRTAFEEMLDTTKFFGDSMRPGWTEVQHKFLLFCLQERVVTEAELRTLVRERLLAWGRENYHWLFEKSIMQKWPDHAPCSRALAYAIQEKALPEKAIARIVFDHGDTAETFARRLTGEILEDAIRHMKHGDGPRLAIVK